MLYPRIRFVAYKSSYSESYLCIQGPHCTEKTWKMAKRCPVRENKEFGILPKHRENTRNLVCPSCKFHDSKDTEYCVICCEFFSRGNIPVGQGKQGNLKIEYEWGLCIHTLTYTNVQAISQGIDTNASHQSEVTARACTSCSYPRGCYVLTTWTCTWPARESCHRQNAFPAPEHAHTGTCSQGYDFYDDRL